MRVQSINVIYKLIFLVGILIFLPTNTEASAGDRTQAFQDCLYFCRRNNCTADTDGVTHYDRVQPFYLKVLQWDCEEECKYFCMWYTLDRFAKGSYWVPQFYGKWPFVRIFGIQEPASTLFSLLNLYSHVKMIRTFRGDASRNTPFFYFWHIYFLICVNSWICSTVFHARDTPTTEKLDYLGAFAMVLFSLYALIIRYIGFKNKILVGAVSLFFASFYYHHIYNLFYVAFDYNHNMNVNILVGTLQITGWLIWCAVRHKRQPYVWRCSATMFLVIITTLLEVIDFPPLLKVFDAHSLWHLSTAVLPVLWYREQPYETFTQM
ncbi:post-GPI attachment to proteins factor 3-like isoform X2 [Artemia franciscana]|uniref:post-GPI attachment to proteins factor 3-like isoform X2 n=1 Tax=Artemia franciscana TaxID=6661 RepID=UPI0032DA1532